MTAKLAVDKTYRAKRFDSGVVIRAYRECKRIKDYVLLIYTVLFCLCEYPSRDLKSLLGFVGNSALVKRKSYYKTAVFLCERKDSIKALLLSAYRVYHCLAVVSSKRLFHSDGVRGVYLQWQSGYCLKLTDRASKHISLVYFGKTYVYVKDVNSLFFLRNSFLENVVHISLAQSLLEALFTRGIYALSDKHGALTEDHCVSIGRNEGVALFFYGYGSDICAALSKKRNMLGCRAAASACYQHAFLNERAYFRRKFLRCYIIYRLTVFGFGKSGVWLENYGN